MKIKPTKEYKNVIIAIFSVPMMLIICPLTLILYIPSLGWSWKFLEYYIENYLPPIYGDNE